MDAQIERVGGELSPDLSRTVGFDLLESSLALDVREALRTGFAEGVQFANGTSPLAIFRQSSRSGNYCPGNHR
jgi:hypothetical protein